MAEVQKMLREDEGNEKATKGLVAGGDLTRTTRSSVRLRLSLQSGAPLRDAN